MKTIIEVEIDNADRIVVWNDGQLSGDPQVITLLNHANDLLDDVGPVGGPYTTRHNHLNSLLSVLVILSDYGNNIRTHGDRVFAPVAPVGAEN